MKLENNDLSIIVPVSNEEKWINRCYSQLKNFLDTNNISANIVFASDGCTDATPEIIDQIASKDKMVIHFNDKKKLGRGRALKRVFEKIQSKYIVYIDSDLATDLDYLIPLLNGLDEGNDIVTGSRLLPESICTRNNKRTVASKTYNFLTRSLFRSKIKDHQCGFKAFNYNTTHKLIHDIRDNDWFWDTELIIRGQKEKLKIKEIPILWKDRSQEDSKVSVFSDAKTMGLSLFKLRWELFPVSFKQFIKFAIVGLANTFISYFVLVLLEVLNIRRDWGYPAAYFVGLVNSFIWNRRYTFSIDDKENIIRDFIKFLIVNLFGLITYSLVGIYSEKNYNLSIFWSNIIGVICSVIVQFLFYKYYVFVRISKKNDTSV